MKSSGDDLVHRIEVAFEKVAGERLEECVSLIGSWAHGAHEIRVDLGPTHVGTRHRRVCWSSAGPGEAVVVEGPWTPTLTPGVG